MEQIPRKPVKKSHNLLNIDLDAAALVPGQTIDLGSDEDTAGLPPRAPRAGNVNSERPDFPPNIPLHVAQEGRRISPLVSGRRAAPAPQPRQEEVRRPVEPVRQLPPRPIARLPDPPKPPAVPAAKPASGSLVVQLGRFGDIINILPLMLEEFHERGTKTKLMVAGEFASVLDGVSYVEPVIFNGYVGELDKAMEQARKIDPAARCSQVYMPGKKFPRTEDSFARDSWARLGKNHKWESLPLVFDRRSRSREEQIAALHDWSKPVVLLSLGGESFKFERAQEVRDFVKLQSEKLGFTVIDITDFRAPRIFDLLGLFDRATCLITTDTATQHLACASSVPVIAFRVGQPWVASPRRANHILNRRYTDFEMRELKFALTNVVKKSGGSIIHVYPVEEHGAEISSREAMARLSFNNALVLPGQGMSDGLEIGDFQRDSMSALGDDRATIYMVDILKNALERARNPDDIILYTNGDVGFSDTAIRDIRALVKLKGACYGYRFDHHRIDTSMDHLATVSADCHGGLDVFAFSKRWLDTHGGKLPDMLLGRSGWDLVYRDVVKKTGGGEVYGAVWHENHAAWWKQNFNSPGNAFNTEKLKKYRSQNDHTRPFDR